LGALVVVLACKALGEIFSLMYLEAIVTKVQLQLHKQQGVMKRGTLTIVGILASPLFFFFFFS
jgi:hypothetical protein